MGQSYLIQTRETGSVIGFYSSRIEAEEALALFEEEDRVEGIYIPNFYELIKRDLSTK